MKTNCSFLNPYLGAIALMGMALSSAAWAGTSSGPTVVSNPQAKRDIVMIYPYEALLQGKTGWAEASFVVDYAGRPLFTNASDASDPAFAKAAIAMIEANQYTPIKKDRRLSMTQASQRVVFPGEAALDPEAKRILSELRKPTPAICNQSELDARPKAVRQDAPVYPRAMKDDGLTGQAEIEFIVTSEGKVLFPHIISATQEDFGWAAAAAVAQWRFQPPTRNGHKVDVRLTVPVLFDANRLASAD